MGRTYAGILGLVAFLTMLGRGLLHGGSVESTFQLACLVLLLFAAFGWVIGSLAARTIDESVQLAFDLEVKNQLDSQDAD